MATVYWQGGALPVAQVDTVTITADDAATTYKITIGGVVVSVLGSGTGTTATALALQVALSASAHPYFAAITWTALAAVVTGTAAVAGAPFVAASSVSGGTGTIGAVTSVTVSSGPNDWSVASNWDGGTVPVSTDDVIFSDSADPICWGLAQSAVTLDSLTINKNFTGRIGHNYQNFATSANGLAFTVGTPEYREVYLAISATVCDIGRHIGPGTAQGQQRLMLDLGSNVSAITVYDTAASSIDAGRAAVRLKNVHASSTLEVRSAPAGVALADGIPGEVSTVASVSVGPSATSGLTTIGSGVTVPTIESLAGAMQLSAAATITTMTIEGGTVTTYGDLNITTANVRSGSLNAWAVASSGVEIATLNLAGGTVDVQIDTEARTFTTVNHEGGTLSARDDLTITTYNEPTGKLYSLAVS